jgi:hypothetical protein
MLLNLGYGYGMKRISNHSTLRLDTLGSTVIFFLDDETADYFYHINATPSRTNFNFG